MHSQDSDGPNSTGFLESLKKPYFFTVDSGLRFWMRKLAEHFEYVVALTSVCAVYMVVLKFTFYKLSSLANLLKCMHKNKTNEYKILSVV